MPPKIEDSSRGYFHQYNEAENEMKLLLKWNSIFNILLTAAQKRLPEIVTLPLRGSKPDACVMIAGCNDWGSRISAMSASSPLTYQNFGIATQPIKCRVSVMPSSNMICLRRYAASGQMYLSKLSRVWAASGLLWREIFRHMRKQSPPSFIIKAPGGKFMSLLVRDWWRGMMTPKYIDFLYK